MLLHKLVSVENGTDIDFLLIAEHKSVSFSAGLRHFPCTEFIFESFPLPCQIFQAAL